MSAAVPADTAPGRRRAALLAAIPLLAALFFFAPILGNYFYGDDLLNLYHAVNWGFWHYVLAPYAGHVLVLRNAIFYASFELFGPRPSYFFATVLVTHLVNVLLLYRVVAVFSGSARLACFGALFWGIAPLNEGTIGWYSVYGQSLVATGALWLLLALARVAEGRPPSRRRLAAMAVVVVAISTLFGTGTGVAMAIPLAAALVLPRLPARRRVLSALIAGGLAVPVLYYGLHLLARRLAWQVSGTSLTQLSHHVPVLLELFLRLLGRGVESLFLGRSDVPIEELPAVVFVVAFAAVLVVAAFAADGAARRRLLAFLGLAAASYFMITLGRGAMVAKGMRPELVLSAERYQYLGPLFLTVALCIAVEALGRRARLAPRAADALLAAALLVAIGARVAVARPIDPHRWARVQTEEAVQRLRAAIAAAPAEHDLYLRLPEKPFRGVGPMLINNPHLFPSWAGVFAVFFPDNVVAGRRVRFVTDDPRILLSQPKGLRSASLFVAAKDLPPDQPVVDF